MSVLKEKFKSDKIERSRIDQQVVSEAIRPSKEESQIVQDVMSEVAEAFKEDISTQGFSDSVVSKIKKYIEYCCDNKKIDYETKKKVERLALANITGLGPIQPYIEDESITEILVIHYDRICVERNGLIEETGTSFMSEEHLRTIINRIVQPIGRQINIQYPLVDGRLEDGSRINATIPPASPDGATLTIRKFSKKALTGDDYLNLGSISAKMLLFLKACVQGKINIMVSGGTTAGKTTLLNMLSLYIPQTELIVTIEDSCELKLNQPNVRRLEARATQSDGAMPITIQTLVKNSLRMRPDRIIVGEIRDQTIVDMMSAMSTGHAGSLSTIHANSPKNMVNSRMPILYSMSDKNTFSENAQKRQISEALQIIVQISHIKTGERVITHITHIKGLDNNGEILLEDIFRYDETNKIFYSTGYVPIEILEQLNREGIDYIKPDLFEEEVIT